MNMRAAQLAAAGKGLKGHQSPNVNHCTACGEFMKIPPLLRAKNGQCYINPDFDMVKKWHQPAFPFGGTDGTLAAGETKDFAITVQAEENSMGDMLINELLAMFDPVGARDVFVEFVSLQNDRLLSNVGVSNTLLFGTSQLNCCLPCCLMIQATNTLVLRVTNNEAVPVECFFMARGKRFLPYHDPALRGRMLSYWNSIPTTPYYLGIDNDGEVTVPAAVGANPGTEEVTMTVPGGGDFEVKWPRVEIVDAGATTLADVRISVVEGVGRQWSPVPIPLPLVATPTLAVTGFPGNLYNAASACSCEQYTQFFKRNSRVRLIVENHGPDPVTVRFVIAGCMHYVSECPPGRSLDRIRSLEPTVGPMLIDDTGMCPPAQEVEPVPGRGLVPVSAINAPTNAMPGGMWVPPPAAPPVLGPGYGAGLFAPSLPPAMQGMGAMQQAQLMAQAAHMRQQAARGQAVARERQRQARQVGPAGPGGFRRI